MKAFTLIELMVTVAIIGVLFSMAIPMYDKNILKNRFESEAVVTLKSLQLAQEQFYNETGNYYTTTSDNTISNEDEISDNLKIDLKKSNNFIYQLLKTTTDQSYIIRAILRSEAWDTDCDGKSSTYICKQSNSRDEDIWVYSYSSTIAIDKHYLELKYPVPSSSASSNGIDYTNMY